MNSWINYHHLYYFKVIAEEGTVSKAAEKLRVGQPTLSAQLKQFEDTLGIDLFNRQHKKLILTEQGQVALDYARSIFQMGSEMLEVLNDRLKPSKPSLCIGSLDTISKSIVVQAVEAALKFSNCQITLVEGRPGELLRELSAHRVDLLLTNFVPQAMDAKGLRHRVVTEKSVGIYGAAKFKKLKKNFPDSVSGQPIIVPTYDSKLRYDLDHWSRSSEVALDILIESQDIAVRQLMAVNGLGLLAAATHTVQNLLESGELFEIGHLKGVHEQLILVTAERKIENPIANKLMDHFKV